MSINLDTDFSLIYFFYERDRIIAVSPNRILVYFWTKTLTHNPILIKDTRLSLFKGQDIKITTLKNFTPKVLFYQNDIV